jgi:putative endonuclease
MHFAYILESEKDGKRYIGSTSNLYQRLAFHNAGKNTSTKYRTPLKIIFSKQFADKKSATVYER